ncbi:hypothetical protein HAX54_002675 [Datura stramonium]|uniref:Terpene synthase metal-binding domain-containing protein n=1 Tax=Datura stramonium TaxID=4076 RepID=A0ABS8RT04_DATST|nr:hypothetical protein [Datura stramonium]
MDFVKTLSYARNRAVECYFWTVGVYAEPQYSQARVMLAKTIAMISIVDDTFDAYGIVKELEVYTDAIQSNKIDFILTQMHCDLQSKVEKGRGQIATGIECYMRDYGVSTEEAMEKFQEMAEIAWKDVNEGILRPTPVSAKILTRILNLARIIDVTYKHNQDGYTHPEKVLKPHIIALLVDSIEI